MVHQGAVLAEVPRDAEHKLTVAKSEVYEMWTRSRDMTALEKAEGEQRRSTPLSDDLVLPEVALDP